jgi:hypothetical protein
MVRIKREGCLRSEIVVETRGCIGDDATVPRLAEAISGRRLNIEPPLIRKRTVELKSCLERLVELRIPVAVVDNIF